MNSDPNTIFVVLQGFMFHTKKDLRIYGCYSSSRFAEKAVKVIGTKYQHPVFEDLEGPSSPVPPTILEIPLDVHPDNTAYREGCHLSFKRNVGLDPFWLCNDVVEKEST